MTTNKQTASLKKGEAGETIVERITEAIRQAVRDGHYSEGERIVVADLSEEFGVSFGPVREAIRRLTGEGLLTFTAHKGASVRTYTEKEVRESGQLREAVEGYIAKLAAENIDRADYRKRLIEFSDELERAMTCDNPEVSSAARQSFHDILYEIAGNQTLADEGRRFTFEVMRVRFNRLMGDARERQSLYEHQLIIEAILAGEGILAERLMRNHINTGVIAICETMERERRGHD